MESRAESHSEYWRRIVDSAARLALGDHRAPRTTEYEAWVSARLFAVRDRVVGTLVPVLARSCRADLNVLPAYLVRTRPRCFQCGSTSTFEAWIWGEEGTVDETVCVCVAHAFDLQCAWILLRLPRAVYHSVRVRREWEDPAHAAHLAQWHQCAVVAAHRLGVRPPGTTSPVVPPRLDQASGRADALKNPA